MTNSELRRVVFYSKEDLSWEHNLTQAERLLDDLDFEHDFDVNDFIEFYNIKLYFDNKLFLPDWNDKKKETLYEKTNKAFEKAKIFYLGINDDNFLKFFEDVNLNYRKSFWELISRFKVYKNISNETFSILLSRFPFQITKILLNEGIIKYFSSEIKQFLMEYEKSAELLLRSEQDSSKPVKYFFPKMLSHHDKEDIFSRYLDLDMEKINLNYVQLIEQSNNSGALKLGEKVKFKAYNKAKELADFYFEKEGSLMSFGAKVFFSDTQREPRLLTSDGSEMIISYSKTFFDSKSHPVDLFHLFKNIFSYTNQGVIEVINKEYELSLFEKISMKSKNVYPIGCAFQQKDTLLNIQAELFNNYLIKRKSSVESLIESFLAKYLSSLLGRENFRFSIPSPETNYFEKIRTLLPELECLLKQYKLYVEDGKIDFEYIKFNSSPIRLSNIKSLNRYKYVYGDSEDVKNLQHVFFSDQSGLYYTERFKTKWECLFDLLINENVFFDDFADYQKTSIQYLINEEYLFIDESNCVSIKKIAEINTIGYLYKNEVLNYWHYNQASQEVIDKMIKDGLLSLGNTFLSIQEIDYLNFYLNKKKFTNGYDLRNKYSHGTNPSSPTENKTDYYKLLKIIVLILLKIEDDLVIYKLFEQEKN